MDCEKRTKINTNEFKFLHSYFYFARKNILLRIVELSTIRYVLTIVPLNLIEYLFEIQFQGQMHS